VLVGIAATSVAGTGACGPSDGDAASGGNGGSGGFSGTGGSGGANGCVLYPEQTEGPFYLDLDSLRRDITEGKTGAALRMVVRVQDESCAPLKDLAVDVWHCDVAGVYSGFPGQLGNLDTSGQTFLRGTQVTGDDGVATFDTIYPGWYPGRTTHIHFKVHTSSNAEATSQIYFPENTTSQIYGSPPYDVRGQKDTSNSADAIAVASPAPLAEVTGNSLLGYVATIVVTVA
jgi:protocatechuate 3,4-dioxygenase beta subunit